MRYANLYVPLPPAANERLRELARRELRDPRTQAAYLIIAGLRAAGLDPDQPNEPKPEAAR